MAAVRCDCCGQIDEGVELLLLTRTRDRQEAFDGAFPVFTARAETDLPPLSRVPDYAE
jgi:hypothetical protein